MTGEWGRRLTRFLAGAFLGEPNEMRRRASSLSEDDELHAAWDDLHAATPAGWFARPPERRHGAWAMSAFDTTEGGSIGERSRACTAVGATEIECVREMARCLREISEGRVPR